MICNPVMSGSKEPVETVNVTNSSSLQLIATCVVGETLYPITIDPGQSKNVVKKSTLTVPRDANPIRPVPGSAVKGLDQWPEDYRYALYQVLDSVDIQDAGVG